MITLNRDYWPTQDWRGADPQSVGMRGELLSDLDREIKARFRSINAFLVIRRGYLVFESYYSGFGQDDTHLVASVTKSFISAFYVPDKRGVSVCLALTYTKKKADLS